MAINVVACVLEEYGGPSPWSLQLSVRIGFAAPVVADCKVNAIVKCAMGESRRCDFMCLRWTTFCFYMAFPHVADVECDLIRHIACVVAMCPTLSVETSLHHLSGLGLCRRSLF